jgi:Fic family protein
MAWDLETLQEHLLIGSTLVEGSTLTADEASQVLAGLTVSGHPLAEMRELVNYRDAVAWLMSQLETVPYLSEDLIRELHRRLVAGLSDAGGRYKSHANFTYRVDGSKHHYVKPARVEAAMRAWIGDFNAKSFQTSEQGAAALYYGLVHIHPFGDGNGRIGRVLIAYWLHWKWQRSWSFHLDDKQPHLDALHAANDGSFVELARFFDERIRP